MLYIALFRAINVLGKNLLPMKELKEILSKLGAEEVRTYIQSGNVVMNHKEKDAKKLSNKIKAAIKKSHGFEPNVLLLEQKDVEKAFISNPFPKGEELPKTVHAFFCETKPKNPDFKKMDEIKTDTERYELIDKIYYLHTPDGFGRSKLAARCEKLLGVPATARNWRTVKKIKEMIDDVS